MITIANLIPFPDSFGFLCEIQEWNSDFGLDKDRKKESRQGF